MTLPAMLPKWHQLVCWQDSISVNWAVGGVCKVFAGLLGSKLASFGTELLDGALKAKKCVSTHQINCMTLILLTDVYIFRLLYLCLNWIWAALRMCLPILTYTQWLRYVSVIGASGIFLPEVWKPAHSSHLSTIRHRGRAGNHHVNYISQNPLRWELNETIM